MHHVWNVLKQLGAVSLGFTYTITPSKPCMYCVKVKTRFISALHLNNPFKEVNIVFMRENHCNLLLDIFYLTESLKSYIWLEKKETKMSVTNVDVPQCCPPLARTRSLAFWEQPKSQTSVVLETKIFRWEEELWEKMEGRTPCKAASWHSIPAFYLNGKINHNNSPSERLKSSVWDYKSVRKRADTHDHHSQ